MADKSSSTFGSLTALLVTKPCAPPAGPGSARPGVGQQRRVSRRLLAARPFGRLLHVRPLSRCLLQ